MKKQYVDFSKNGTIEIYLDTTANSYKDICILEVPNFLFGARTFNCKCGGMYTLNKADVAKINNILRTNRLL